MLMSFGAQPSVQPTPDRSALEFLQSHLFAAPR
jgi:hypothetical protein